MTHEERSGALFWSLYVASATGASNPYPGSVGPYRGRGNMRFKNIETAAVPKDGGKLGADRMDSLSGKVGDLEKRALRLAKEEAVEVQRGRELNIISSDASTPGGTGNRGIMTNPGEYT